MAFISDKKPRRVVPDQQPTAVAYDHPGQPFYIPDVHQLTPRVQIPDSISRAHIPDTVEQAEAAALLIMDPSHSILDGGQVNTILDQTQTCLQLMAEKPYTIHTTVMVMHDTPGVGWAWWGFILCFGLGFVLHIAWVAAFGFFWYIVTNTSSAKSKILLSGTARHCLGQFEEIAELYRQKSMPHTPIVTALAHGVDLVSNTAQELRLSRAGALIITDGVPTSDGRAGTLTRAKRAARRALGSEVPALVLLASGSEFDWTLAVSKQNRFAADQVPAAIQALLQD